MTEEEKKEFEEFLQWKAEKKQKEEEEEAERQAKLVDQNVLQQIRLELRQILLILQNLTIGKMKKVNLINLYKKAYLVYVFLYL